MGPIWIRHILFTYCRWPITIRLTNYSLLTDEWYLADLERRRRREAKDAEEARVAAGGAPAPVKQKPGTRDTVDNDDMQLSRTRTPNWTSSLYIC